MREGAGEGAEEREGRPTAESAEPEHAERTAENAESEEAPPTRERRRRRLREPRRFPGWVLIPLGGGAGWFFGGWGGLVFGAVVGFFLWRTRA